MSRILPIVIFGRSSSFSLDHSAPWSLDDAQEEQYDQGPEQDTCINKSLLQIIILQ